MQALLMMHPGLMWGFALADDVRYDGISEKSEKIRWVTLGFTLIYLGWMDGGFVSVSHITNFVKIGPSMFRSDLPQLLILIFTVVTTLFWGRVFCSSFARLGASRFYCALYSKKV